MTPARKHFARAVWLGIAGNVALAAPLIVAPAWALNLFGIPVPETLVWVRLSGTLVVLLSMLYLPAAVMPDKLGKLCWLLVAARAGAAAFFLVQGGPYLLFAGYDMSMGAVLSFLLLRGFASP